MVSNFSVKESFEVIQVFCQDADLVHWFKISAVNLKGKLMRIDVW